MMIAYRATVGEFREDENRTMEKEFMTFGQRLTYTRQQKGLSQKQLANLIGTNQTKLACWETDKRASYVPMLGKIIAALEVPEDWLTGKNDNVCIENSTEIKLTLKQQQLVDDNANMIPFVFNKVFKYSYLISYEDFYGDAAIALCEAAKHYDEEEKHKGPFFPVAFTRIKWALLNSYNTKKVYYRHNASLNEIVWQDDDGNGTERGDLIPAPDEWESFEYKILAESVYQKLEPVLTAKEKEVFRPWLHGVGVPEIAQATNVKQHTVRTRMTTARKKCIDAFNANEIFS